MKEMDLILDLCIPDEERATEIFRSIRWADGLHSPKCNSLSIQKRGIQVNISVIPVTVVDLT